MQSTKGGSSRPVTRLRPRYLRVYGGGGKAPRWELTYSCIPEAIEAVSYPNSELFGSVRRNEGELPRELPKRQKQEENTSVLHEGWRFHNEHTPPGVTDLFCNEGLELDECDFLSERGENSGSNGASGIWYPEGLRSNAGADSEMHEIIERSCSDVISELNGLCEPPDMGSKSNPISLGGNGDWQEFVSETPPPSSPVVHSHGQAKAVQREISWGDFRRYELPSSSSGSPDSHIGYLRRASDSLPQRECSIACWYTPNNNEQSVPWEGSGGNRSSYKKENHLMGSDLNKKGKEKIG